MKRLAAALLLLLLAVPSGALAAPLSCASNCPDRTDCKDFNYDFAIDPFTAGDIDSPSATLCENFHHSHWNNAAGAMKAWNALTWPEGNPSQPLQCTGSDATTSCSSIANGTSKSCSIGTGGSCGGALDCTTAQCVYCSGGVKTTNNPVGLPACSSARLQAFNLMTDKHWYGVRRGARVDINLPRDLDPARGEHIALFNMAHVRSHIGYQLTLWRLEAGGLVPAENVGKYQIRIEQTFDSGLTTVPDGGRGGNPEGPLYLDCQGGAKPGCPNYPQDKDKPWRYRVPFYTKADLLAAELGDPGAAIPPANDWFSRIADDDIWGDHPYEVMRNNTGELVGAFALTPGTVYTLTLLMEPDLSGSPPKMKLTGSITSAGANWCGTGCSTISISHSFLVNNRNARDHAVPWLMPQNADTITTQLLRQPPGPPVWAYRFNGGKQSASRMSIGGNFNGGPAQPLTIDNFSGFACDNRKGAIPPWENPWATPTPVKTPRPTPSATPPGVTPTPTPTPAPSPSGVPTMIPPTPTQTPKATPCPANTPAPSPLCPPTDPGTCPTCPSGFSCNAEFCGAFAGEDCCCFPN